LKRERFLQFVQSFALGLDGKACRLIYRLLDASLTGKITLSVLAERSAQSDEKSEFQSSLSAFDEVLKSLGEFSKQQMFSKSQLRVFLDINRNGWLKREQVFRVYVELRLCVKEKLLLGFIEKLSKQAASNKGLVPIDLLVQLVFSEMPEERKDALSVHNDSLQVILKVVERLKKDTLLLLDDLLKLEVNLTSSKPRIGIAVVELYAVLRAHGVIMDEGDREVLRKKYSFDAMYLNLMQLYADIKEVYGVSFEHLNSRVVEASSFAA